jgi:phage recombination protein Bet
MAVGNSLAKQQGATDNQSIEYESNGTMVKLSPAIVKNYLVNGNGNVTNQEIVMFLNLCKAQHLNPFLREAYLIKFGSSQASIVTGKEVFTKRAQRNKNYAGQQAGIIVQKEDSSLENRIGTLKLDGESIVGGWAKVFIKGYDVPVELTVSFDEYVGLKSDGSVNGQWAKKPATMIRKVALVQALREAFPEELQGMYDQDEMSIDVPNLPEQPIEQPIEQPQEVIEQPESDPLA